MGSVVKKAGGLVGAAAGFALGGPAGAALGAQIGGGLQQSAAAGDQAKAIEQAGQTGADAARNAAEIQRQMFERQVALQEPWRQAGVGALNKLIPLASEYTPFGTQQFQQDPGYAFRMSEGMKALERSAAARGGLLSGAQMKGVQRYGQDLASQEYQNAFQRYQTERQARLNPLQSLAGVGQTATQQIGEFGGQTAARMGQAALSGGANVANAMIGAGNVRASQYGGIGSALGTALSNPQIQNYLGSIYGGSGMGQSDFSRGYTPANYG
jgi:hypothetical protein